MGGRRRRGTSLGQPVGRRVSYPAASAPHKPPPEGRRVRAPGIVMTMKLAAGITPFRGLAPLVLLATCVLIGNPAEALDPSAAGGETAADPLAPPAVVSFETTGPDGAVRPGGHARFVIQLAIEPPWHINAHQSLDEFL